MSGLDLSYALQKLCSLLGNTIGLLGIVLLSLRVRHGLFMVIGSPPLLIAAATLGASPTAYPDLERLPLIMLWCVNSALWGGVIAYAAMGYKILFRR